MPSGESWESTGREDDGAACSSVRDVRRGGNGGCSQKADQRTYIDGSSELSFTAATGMAVKSSRMTPLAEMSPGKLFSQDSEGAEAICPLSP